MNKPMRLETKIINFFENLLQLLFYIKYSVVFYDKLMKPQNRLNYN